MGTSAANRRGSGSGGSSSGVATPSPLDVAQRADAFHAEGFAYRKRGDYDAAIQAYSRAIELDPGHFKAYFNRGFAYDKVQ